MVNVCAAMRGLVEVWLQFYLISMILCLCFSPLVEATQPNSLASLVEAVSSTVPAATAAATAAASAAALAADRRRRDKDAGDSRDAKTIESYVSVFRNFYRWCRAHGRETLVPPETPNEKLRGPSIFGSIDHAKFAAEEADITSCSPWCVVGPFGVHHGVWGLFSDFLRHVMYVAEFVFCRPVNKA